MNEYVNFLIDFFLNGKNHIEDYDIDAYKAMLADTKREEEYAE